MIEKDTTPTQKQKDREENYYPYTPLTRVEIVEKLAVSKRHADEGRIMPAHQASTNIRNKYGL